MVKVMVLIIRLSMVAGCFEFFCSSKLLFVFCSMCNEIVSKAILINNIVDSSEAL